ncbi:ALDH-like protein [Hymenopellis radicata]|nr:ALDH-like protein [Hymenopellis radicata]
MELPLLVFTWKLGPALATGNCIILKPSEFTPLTAIRICSIIQEVAAMSSHMDIEKVAFTGSTLVGRKVMEAAAKSNLKDDEFVKRFTELTKNIKVGDPFADGIDQGPQVSQQQYDRIMGYIRSGKEQGATVHHGGERHGNEGYFISPTIFTNTTPDIKIVQEEIFGPVGVLSSLR